MGCDARLRPGFAQTGKLGSRAVKTARPSLRRPAEYNGATGLLKETYIRTTGAGGRN